ncbi:MAG: autotransporter-associated beta strand repeat-containing protein, partial [Akkermansia sp.]|nr:autotransporter-associated beta strand repeat-containing protein [Akkermansia sp.]
MKLRVNLSLRKALLACMAAVSVLSTSGAYGAASYIVEGVDKEALMDSELFYDTGKGYYWDWEGYEPYEGAKKLYEETNSYAFLGDLAGRVATSSGISSSTFSNISNDGDSCWYQVASNVLQYWQSCYGIFASDSVYGYTYNRDYADDLGGTQSLKLGMFFYDNWENYGGNLTMAADWYLSGVYDDYYNQTGYLKYTGKAGFFYKYFGEDDTTVYSPADAIDPASMAETMASHLGMEKQKDGSYQVVRQGHIAELSLGHYEGGSRWGHSLTLYGFSVDDMGMLESIQVTNSDDQTYKLYTLYVKYADGTYQLYEDAACKNLWIYAGIDWQIESISSINTPTTLLQMYESYSSSENPLVWTGKQSTWKAPQAYSIGEALPDATTGWEVKVGDDYFPAYADAGRKVRFDDYAKDGKVSVQGTLSTSEMILANNSVNYSFTGASSASIQAEKLIVSGSADTTFSNVSISGNTALVQRGLFELGKGSKMTYSTATVNAEAVFKLNSGTAQFNALTLGAHSSLLITANSSLSASTMNVSDHVVFQYSTPGALLEFDGALSASSSIRVDYTGAATSGSSYALIHFADGLSNWDSIFQTGYGTLSFSNNTLYIKYNPIIQKVHGVDFSAMNSSLNPYILVFNGQASGDVLVNGVVSPYAMQVTEGSYVLKDGSATGVLAVMDSIALSGDAVLQSNLASLEGNRISMVGSSQLKLAATGNNTIGGLSAAPSTTVQVLSAVTTFEEVSSMGKLTVDASAGAVFNNAEDLTIRGLVRANGSLVFQNGASSGAVVYTLEQSNNVLSNVTIGETDSALSPRVTLAVPGNVAGNFNILADGELRLLGNGSFTAPATGSGQLSVAQGAEVQFSVLSGSATFAEDLHLQVDGTAVVGDENNLLYNKFGENANVSISGHLTLYGRTTLSYGSITRGYLIINSLNLDGGTLLYANTYDPSSYENATPFVRDISSLDVESGGGTIISRSWQGYTGLRSNTNITSFSGSGNLNLHGQSYNTLNLFRIANLGSAGYSGTITLLHDSISWSNAAQDQATVLELKSMTLEGDVFIKTIRPCNDPDSNAKFITALGIDGDVELGGLGSTKNPVTRVYLYSGAFKNSVRELPHSSNISSFIDKSTHTLTLNTKENFAFYGAVYDSLNLVKKGKGEQHFMGDMSLFNGTVDVQGGTLWVKNDLSASSVQVRNSSLGSDAEINTGTSLVMNNGTIQASSLVSTAAQFSGHNTITASAVEGGTWTLNLTTSHMEQAVVSMSGSLTLSGITVACDAEKMFSADYLLVRSTGTISLSGELENSRIVTETIDGVQYQSLVYTIVGGGLFLPRTTPTTLTWNANSGTWAVKTGHAESLWSSSTTDSNYYDGDTAAFIKSADVTLSGALKPKAVTVSHAGGTVLFSGGGSITGAASLTKTGAGTLDISTANTYTGGTTIAAGTLIARSSSALGTGGVTMTGGELDMANNTLSNDITVSGNVTLSRAGSYGGKLTLSSGSLSGDTIRLSKTATLAGGSVKAALSGQGGVSVSGNVSMSGASSYTGNTVLNSAKLTIGNNKATGRGQVSNSGTSTMTIQDGIAWELHSPISNSGTLTIIGALDASNMEGIIAPGPTYSKGGNNGFQISSSHSIKVVEGTGKLYANATVWYGDVEMELQNDGVAFAEGEIDYSTYYITDGHRATVSSFKTQVSDDGLTAIYVENVRMSGGDLSADRDIAVETTGGNIEHINGNLSGNISGTKLSIAGNYGTVSATLSGTNSLSGKLRNVLSNTGTLYIDGPLNIEQLGGLIYSDYSYTESGNNGFRTGASCSVKVIDNSGDGRVIVADGVEVYRDVVRFTLGEDGIATAQGQTDYTTYYITAGHSATVSGIRSKSGGALRMIDMTGGILQADASVSSTVNASGGEIRLSAGNLSGSISGSTLSISGGKLLASLSGTNTLSGSITLSNVLTNTGTLNISGTLDATNIGALTVSPETYTEGGLNGFKTGSDYSIKLINNTGTINNSAIVRHGKEILTLDNSGVASVKGKTDFSTYYITQGHTATVSTIAGKSGGALALIEMTGGVLNANQTAELLATGGDIRLSAGELSGSISGAKLGITGGTLTATLTGSNTLSGSNKLSNVLTNTGTLNVSGTLDVSGVGALSGSSVTYTAGGTNGFKTTSAHSIKLVENTGTINSTATVKHGSVDLTLGNNGFALADAVTDYSIYYIGNGHAAAVSDMVSQSASRLERIDMTGGVLTADSSMEIKATGGEINLTGGELSGSISGAKLGISGGTLSATLSGTNTLSGSNTLSNVLTNTGTLNISGSLDVTNVGGLTASGESFTEGGCNGFKTGSDYSIRLVNNTGTINCSARILHGDKEFTLGNDGVATAEGKTDFTTYYITENHTATVTDMIAKSGGALKGIDMAGGTLRANASAKVDAAGGDILLSSGDLSGRISGASLSLTGGTLSATLFGTNTLSGSNILSNVLTNTGTLNISGTLDVTNVGDLESVKASYTDGEDSGFSVGDFLRLQLVNNSGTLNSSALITHGDVQLTLGNDGVATTQVVTDYSTYYVGANHTAKVSDIEAKAGGALEKINVNGGSLYVNKSAKLASGSGSVFLTDDAVIAGSLNNTKISSAAGDFAPDIQATVAGTSSISVAGGHVTLSANNSYSGGTSISSGSLIATHKNALGSGVVTMSGGSLDLRGVSVANNIVVNGNASLLHAEAASGQLTLHRGELRTSSAIKGNAQLEGGTLKNTSTGASHVSSGTVTLSGASLAGDFTIAGSKSWLVEADTAVSGSLELGGKGTLTLKNLSTLSVSDSLYLDDFTLRLDGKYLAGESYTLISAKSVSGDTSAITLQGMEYYYSLYVDGSGLVLDVFGSNITWCGDKKDVWKVGSAGWVNAAGKETRFSNGDAVSIGDGNVTIVSKVAPGMVTLSPTKALTLKSNNSGAITGNAHVLIDAGAKAKITMNDGNTYRGGTTIKNGIVNAKGAASFGRGDIELSGGTLNLSGKTISNAITLSGSATIKSGKKYAGTFTMSGGELMKGSQLNLIKDATLSGGLINGALSGTGTVKVTGAVTLGDKAKLTVDKLNITENGTLTASAKGLAMNAKTSAITISGGKLISAGKLTANSLTMKGGELSMLNAKPQAMSFKGDVNLSDAELDFSGKLTATKLTAKNTDIYLTNKNAAQSIALSGKGMTSALTDSTLYANGSMKVAGNLALNNSTLTLVDVAKNKPMALNVTGNLSVVGSGSSLTLSGALSAANLTLGDCTLNMTGTKLQAIKVKQALTFNSNIDLNLGFAVTQKDVDKGKAFKIFTFKSVKMSTSDLHELLGISDDYCTLALDAKGTS